MFGIRIANEDGTYEWTPTPAGYIRSFPTTEDAEALRQTCLEFAEGGECRHEVAELSLHVKDCPMTSLDPSVRSGCACDDGVRDRVEGEGGRRVVL